MTKREIMKRAWETYKAMGCTMKAEFGVALGMAWAEAKSGKIAIEVKYAEYKASLSRFKTVDGSYNAGTKTIQVLVKASSVAIKEISYSEYKNMDIDAYAPGGRSKIGRLTVSNSYNPTTKTIKIYVPASAA